MAECVTRVTSTKQAEDYVTQSFRKACSTLTCDPINVEYGVTWITIIVTHLSCDWSVCNLNNSTSWPCLHWRGFQQCKQLLIGRVSCPWLQGHIFWCSCMFQRDKEPIQLSVLYSLCRLRLISSQELSAALRPWRSIRTQMASSMRQSGRYWTFLIDQIQGETPVPVMISKLMHSMWPPSFSAWWLLHLDRLLRRSISSAQCRRKSWSTGKTWQTWALLLLVTGRL